MCLRNSRFFQKVLFLELHRESGVLFTFTLNDFSGVPTIIFPLSFIPFTFPKLIGFVMIATGGSLARLLGTEIELAAVFSLVPRFLALSSCDSSFRKC
jgi:hypothetical protein